MITISHGTDSGGEADDEETDHVHRFYVNPLRRIIGDLEASRTLRFGSSNVRSLITLHFPQSFFSSCHHRQMATCHPDKLTRFRFHSAISQSIKQLKP